MSSVRRRPDGKWRARYRDEAGKEHARHFPRKIDAQRWLDEVTTSVVTGQYVDPDAGRMTFGLFYAGWATRQVWAPGTRRAMDLAAATTFTEVPLRTLRRSHVEAWVKLMDARGLAPGTIRTRVNNVRAVLRGAVRDRVITSDPTDGVPLPRARRPAAAMTVPTTKQVGTLLDVAGPQFRTFVAVAAFAGLRLGEAAALQVADVRFLARELDVHRQVQRGEGGTIELSPPKYGSERTVYLPDPLVTELSAHVAQHVAHGPPHRWLFAGHRGEPWHQNTVGHHWRRTRSLAGVPALKLHDLRHFYASGLIAEGCDVVTVQRALGHGSATVTLATYAHLWPSAEDRTRAAAGRIMAAALAAPARAADSVRTEQGPPGR